MCLQNEWNAKRTEIHLTSNQIVWYRTETSEKTASHYEKTGDIVVHYTRNSVSDCHVPTNGKNLFEQMMMELTTMPKTICY